MTRTPPRTIERGWRYINHSSGLWSNNRVIHIYQYPTTLYSTHCKLRSASQSSSLRITMPTLSLAVQRNYTRPTRTRERSVGDWLEENKIAGIESIMKSAPDKTSDFIRRVLSMNLLFLYSFCTTTQVIVNCCCCWSTLSRKDSCPISHLAERLISFNASPVQFAVHRDRGEETDIQRTLAAWQHNGPYHWTS